MFRTVVSGRMPWTLTQRQCLRLNRTFSSISRGNGSLWLTSRSCVFSRKFSSVSSDSQKPSEGKVQTESISVENGSADNSSAESEVQSEELEAPPKGRTLLRDCVIGGVLAVIAAGLWTKFSTEKKGQFDSESLQQINAMRAHLALSSNETAVSQPTVAAYHLREAESHCRAAIASLGGGYFDELTQSQTDEKTDVSRKRYEPSVISLHLALAKILRAQRRPKQSIDNYLLVLRAMALEFGAESTELCQVCRDLSQLYLDIGSLHMAQLFVERALSLAGTHSMDGAIVASLYEEKGAICMKLGQFQEAVDSFAKAKAMAELQLKKGGDVSQMQSAANVSKTAVTGALILATLSLNIACGHLELSQFEKALKHSRAALSTAENALSDAKLRGGRLDESLTEMHCSALFVTAQALLGTGDEESARCMLVSALEAASALRQQSKLLLIHDLIRSIDSKP